MTMNTTVGNMFAKKEKCVEHKNQLCENNVVLYSLDHLGIWVPKQMEEIGS